MLKVKILIIEDDNNKNKQIISLMEEAYAENITITEAHSFQKGVKEIRTSQFDYLLLDMTLPAFDIDTNHIGGKIRKFAGIDILMEMKRRKINLKTIIVTQFDSFGDGESLITIKELRKQLNSRFKENFKEIIYYNSSLTTWRDELIIVIENLEKGEIK